MGKKEKIPKTKEECFSILDEMISEEQKAKIAEMQDIHILHFSLGMWIRNHWIYSQSIEAFKALMKQFVNGELSFMSPDDASSIILEAYQEHLRKKKSSRYTKE